MQSPGPVANVPAGLEYLVGLDEIHVQQKLDWVESMSGVLSLTNFSHLIYNCVINYKGIFNFDTNNKYAVLNRDGQMIYKAIEVIPFFYLYI